MNTRRLASLLVILSLVLVNLLLTFNVIQSHEVTPTPIPPHWTYEGEEGPEHWGDLTGYGLCSTGHAQSPIDISAAQSVNLADIAFSYQPHTLGIFNNGHTIQVAYDEGNSWITYNETQYQLLQFHLHHPSEHTLNGESFAMEIHFVHRSADGDLAVVGVLLRASDVANEAYATIFDNMPNTAGTPEPTELTIDPNTLLPAEHVYYTYSGSLTTPPCTQGVRWLVLQTPVDISAEQAEAFGALFELNARPIQPLNLRDLLSDSASG